MTQLVPHFPMPPNADPIAPLRVASTSPEEMAVDAKSGYHVQTKVLWRVNYAEVPFIRFSSQFLAQRLVLPASAFVAAVSV